MGFFRRTVSEPSRQESKTDQQKRATETDGGFRVGNQDPNRRGLGRTDGHCNRDDE